MRVSQLIYNMDKDDEIVINDFDKPIDQMTIYQGAVRGIKKDNPINKMHIEFISADNDIISVLATNPRPKGGTIIINGFFAIYFFLSSFVCSWLAAELIALIPNHSDYIDIVAIILHLLLAIFAIVGTCFLAVINVKVIATEIKRKMNGGK